jgi:hypothetical protein
MRAELWKQDREQALSRFSYVCAQRFPVCRNLALEHLNTKRSVLQLQQLVAGQQASQTSRYLCASATGCHRGARVKGVAVGGTRAAPSAAAACPAHRSAWWSASERAQRTPARAPARRLRRAPCLQRLAATLHAHDDGLRQASALSRTRGLSVVHIPGSQCSLERARLRQSPVARLLAGAALRQGHLATELPSSGPHLGTT